LVDRMAHVQASRDTAGDHVAGSWLGVDLSHGGHQVRRHSGSVFHRSDPFRRRGERIAPEMQGRGPGVIRRTPKSYFSTALSRDRLHNAQRQTETLEHRALLDVELQIAAHLPADLRCRNVPRVKPKRADRLLDVVIHYRIAHQRAAADKAPTLFFGKCHYFE